MSDNAYTLMLQNKRVLTIDRSCGLVRVWEEQLVPFDLYLEDGIDADFLNNIIVFNWWCAHRILSLDREYAKVLLNSCGLKQAVTDKDRADIALMYRCLSLKDPYWVQKENENLDWESVNLFDNSLSNAVVDISLLGKCLTVENSQLICSDLTTDGVFPKAWIRCNGSFVLYKGDRNNSVEKEVAASKILKQLGFDVIEYWSDYYKTEKVSACKCFTSKDIGYVTAGDMSSNYDLERTKEYYLMNLADYLIGNSDRHQDNWGYLFDVNRNILRLVPIFDLNHAFEASPDFQCIPEQLFNNRATMLDIARQCFNIKQLDLLPGTDYYTQYVNDRIRLLYSR